MASRLPALPYVRSGQTAGLSGRAALAQYRAAGGSIRTQDFQRLWSQTQALRAQSLDAMDRPKGAVPTAAQIIDRDTATATGYGQWVAIYQRTRGESDLIVTPYLVKSSEPLTPEQAEAAALGFLGKNPDQYNRTTIGVTYTGTERFNRL